MPDAETPEIVEELRSLNESASDEISPYEVTLRQMMLTCAAVLTEAGGCASCAGILRAAATAGITSDEVEEQDEEGEPTCPESRGRYRCARPPFHIPSDLHATTDGKMTVYWKDHENRVTLKMAPSQEVLAMLRAVKSYSEEANTPE